MDNWFSLRNLSGRVWYIQDMVIKDEKENVLAEITNSQLQSALYTHLLDRWVRGIGVIDGKLVVTIV